MLTVTENRKRHHPIETFYATFTLNRIACLRRAAGVGGGWGGGDKKSSSVKYGQQRHRTGTSRSGAPNENVVQNHLNIALLNVF